MVKMIEAPRTGVTLVWLVAGELEAIDDPSKCSPH